MLTQKVALRFVQPFQAYIDGLVHPSAQHDPLAVRRHRAFIAPRLLGSLIALAAFPIYLVMRGVPTGLEIAIFAWLVVPMLVAYYLSRTGQYERAHILSSLSLAGLIFAIACATGGIASFAAIWLVVVPLEAALSVSRRAVVIASAIALLVAGLLLALTTFSLLPDFDGHAGAPLIALGIISASLYATSLALGTEAMARQSTSLLNAEEERYRLLALNMTDVITRHGRNGAVQFVSPAAEPLFGTRLDDLLGHGLFDRIHVTDRPAYLKALSDAAILGDPQSVEFRVKRSQGDAAHSGGFVWVEMRCRPLDQEGRATSDTRELVAVIRDISDRKSQEQALQVAQAESERAHAAKTRFLATMSHELRTPLNAIIGFSDMLMHDEQMRLDAARRKEYAQLINDSGSHLLEVVNGILDMSKMETGDFEITPEPFAPAPVIDNCCNILALKVRAADIDLIVRHATGINDVMADKRAFKQIMLNLLSNAIKFSHRGGQITVASRTEGARFVVTVTDRGIGIATNDLPRIGDPFFQARSAYDRRHDGTGLGLSIVKGLVDLHGGEMKVTSELGKGTSISICLPLDCETVTMFPHRDAAAQPSKTAILVDDMMVRKSA